MEITDARLVKAYAHPLRMEILKVLENRTMSPSQIASELGSPLSNTSYHVRQLASLGLVELVGRTARRGAIEHHYTAKVRPTITDASWARLPPLVKRAVMDGWLQQTIVDVLAAGEGRGFDRDDAHHTRTSGKVDLKGWKILADELTRMLKRVDKAFEDSEARLVSDPHAESLDATVVFMQFETARPPVSTGADADPSTHLGSERGLMDLKLDEAVPPRRSP